MGKEQQEDKTQELQEIRAKTYQKMRQAPLLSTISRVCGMLGGPLWGTGLLAVVMSVAAAGTGGMAIPLAYAIGMTALGGALSLTSIAIDYQSTRKMQDNGFDQMELGCKTSAHHLVKELKASGMNFAPAVEYNNPGRADGKPWTDVVTAQQIEIKR